MSYEVERDVKIEIIDEGANGVFDESSFVIGEGGAPASRMPEYTREQLRTGVNKEWRQKMRRAIEKAEATQGQNS